jgi:hypothetical protein
MWFEMFRKHLKQKDYKLTRGKIIQKEVRLEHFT